MDNDTSQASIALVLYLHDPAWMEGQELSALTTPLLRRIAVLLETRPAIRLSLYLPGRVIDTAGIEEPALVIRLSELAGEGRLEFLGGGYHDPVLPLWPDPLRRQQIDRLSQSLRRVLRTEARAAWLPGGAWDPSLVTTLASSALEAVPLSTAQLPSVCAEHPWWLVEEHGQSVRVVPLIEDAAVFLRQGAVAEAAQLARNSRGAQALSMALMPEQGGENPPEKPLEDLEKLARLLTEEDPPIRLRTLSALIAGHSGGGRLALGPCAATTFCPPGPGGGWRELLLRAPELNWQHKRTLHLWNRLKEEAAPRARAEATELLMAAQSFVFLCDTDDLCGPRRLRDRIRAAHLLLRAEHFLDGGGGDESPRLDVFDFLCEGRQQVLAGTRRLGLLVEHLRGGRVSVLEQRQGSHAWGLAARPTENPTEPRPWHPVLMERILPAQTALADPADAATLDLTDIAERPWDLSFRRIQRDLQLVLAVETRIPGSEEPSHLRVEKAFTLRSGSEELVASWRIVHLGGPIVPFDFTVEGWISPREPRTEGTLRHRFDDGPWLPHDVAAGALALRWSCDDAEGGPRLTWDANKSARFCAGPLLSPPSVRTSSARFQGFWLLPTWTVDLAPEGSWTLLLRIQPSLPRAAS